jgi:hypothetical protein
VSYITQKGSRRIATASAEDSIPQRHVGFVVVKVALVQLLCEHFGFPSQFSFHKLLHIHQRFYIILLSIALLNIEIENRKKKSGVNTI